MPNCKGGELYVLILYIYIYILVTLYTYTNVPVYIYVYIPANWDKFLYGIENLSSK